MQAAGGIGMSQNSNKYEHTQGEGTRKIGQAGESTMSTTPNPLFHHSLRNTRHFSMWQKEKLFKLFVLLLSIGVTGRDNEKSSGTTTSAYWHTSKVGEKKMLSHIE